MATNTIYLEASLTPGLVPFNKLGGLSFIDDDEISWDDVARMSDRGDNSGTYFWPGTLQEMSPIQYAIAKPYGGYVKSIFGSIGISPDFFQINDDIWPPPDNLGHAQHIGESDADLTAITSGVMHLAKHDRNLLWYEVYSGTLDEIKLLETATNHAGDTVVLPRAFGAVVKERVIRVADVDGKQTYHSGYISAPQFHDCGVNVNSTQVGSTHYWKLDATPIGEVTVSGTGEDSDLDDIVAWICDEDHLDIAHDITDIRSPAPTASRWWDTQIMAVDFLSKLCAFFTHFFYIRDGRLFLLAMETSSGSATYENWEFMPSLYKQEVPIALFRCNWVDNEAGQFRDPSGATAAAQTVRQIPRTTSFETIYPYGREEVEIEHFSTDIDVIDAALEDISTYYHKPQGSIKIPFTEWIDPGTEVVVTDESLVQDMTCTIVARSIQIDPINKVMTITGEGAYT